MLTGGKLGKLPNFGGKHLHTYKHQQGRCVMHLGKRRHGALPISSGRRMSLIMWCHWAARFFFGWMGYDGIFEYIWHILYGTCGSRFLDLENQWVSCGRAHLFGVIAVDLAPWHEARARSFDSQMSTSCDDLLLGRGTNVQRCINEVNVRSFTTQWIQTKWPSIFQWSYHEASWSI